MDQSLLVFLLFLLAIGLGWALGYLKRNRSARSSLALPEAYLTGLDHLIDNRTEEAIESFIEALEVNSDNLSAHIALAKLLRRKGDVDRAVKIHEALLARTDLSQQDQHRVKLALAKDFFLLGLLDRSEVSLRELLSQTTDPILLERALRLLVRLYEREGEWQQALESAEQLNAQARASLKVELGHYYCELATFEIEKGEHNAAIRLLETALERDSDCVRANLTLARVLIQQSQWRSAIRALRHVADQDPLFIPETLSGLRRAYEACNDESGLYLYLTQLLEKTPSTSLLLALAEIKRDREGVLSAGFFITEALKRRPSVRGFNRLIDMHVEHGSSSARESLLTLRGLTQQLELAKPIYRCTHCGFSGRTLVWQCPSCKRWGSIRPIQGLEGE